MSAVKHLKRWKINKIWIFQKRSYPCTIKFEQWLFVIGKFHFVLTYIKSSSLKKPFSIKQHLLDEMNPVGQNIGQFFCQIYCFIMLKYMNLIDNLTHKSNDSDLKRTQKLLHLIFLYIYIYIYINIYIYIYMHIYIYTYI